MGRLDVDQMLDEMSHDQFEEWMEFSQVEPFGTLPEARQRATAICYAVGNENLKQTDLLKSWGFHPPETAVDDKPATGADFARAHGYAP